MPEFNNINTSCGDWKARVLVWESVVYTGWYTWYVKNSEYIVPNALCDADRHLSRLHLRKLQMGLAYGVLVCPCVKYGFRFLGGINLCNLAILTFWAWFFYTPPDRWHVTNLRIFSDLPPMKKRPRHLVMWWQMVIQLEQVFFKTTPPKVQSDCSDCSVCMFIIYVLKVYSIHLENFILGSFGRFSDSMDETFKIGPNKKPWVQCFSDFSHFGHLPFATSRAQHHSWQHLRFCVSPGTGQGNIAGTWHCGECDFSIFLRISKGVV